MNLKDKNSRRLFKIETEDALTLDENIFYENRLWVKLFLKHQRLAFLKWKNSKITQIIY